MKIRITALSDVAKILAFVRANAKGEFVFAQVLLPHVLEELKRLARERRISIDVVTPNEERITAFTSGGLVLGALGGLAYGGAYGAVVGMLIGAAGGYAAAHVVVRIDLSDGVGRLIIQ